MKNIILFSIFLISSCATLTSVEHAFYDNKNCSDMYEFEIFQTVDDGALGFLCDGNGCSPYNQTVFLANQYGIDYYDGMKVSAPKDKCAVIDGVYKYVSKDERVRTVPVISFEYKNNPKNEDELKSRLEDYGDESYDKCLKKVKSNKGKNADKVCGCAVDVFIDTVITAKKDNSSLQKAKEAFDINLNKQCGKVPNYIKTIFD